MQSKLIESYDIGYDVFWEESEPAFSFGHTDVYVMYARLKVLILSSGLTHSSV